MIIIIFKLVVKTRVGYLNTIIMIFISLLSI